MTQRCMMFVLAAIAMASLALTGCKKEEQTAPEAVLEKAAAQPAPAVPAPPALPAEQKPKDHPAH